MNLFLIPSLFLIVSSTPNLTATQNTKKPYPPFEYQPKYEGPCPNLKGTNKWDIDTYSSHNWWQPISTPFFWNFPGSTCISAYYNATGELSNTGGVYFSVVNQCILPEQKQEISGNEYGLATGLGVENTSKNGTASVIFYQGDGIPDSEGDNYTILDTDNVSYSYVWTPTHDDDSCRPILYILVNDRNLSKKQVAGHVESAMAIIRETGWKWADKFEETLEYWPTVNCPDVPDSPFKN